MTFYSNVKQKSYVLNPKGKPLYEDTNRFGTKMLEKMGWSKGKGLGMKEDGEQNFIRVSHKTDQKGMGFQDRDDQWTGHENEFNSLLKSLDNSRNASDNETGNDEPLEEVRTGFGFDSGDKSIKKSKSIKSKISGKSLEEMSKNSSSRVHYRKFTRGKDISRYSEKDLANIFGKKCTNDEPESVAEQPEQTEDPPQYSYGITTIETGTTVQDYFKKKKRNNENPDETEAIVEQSEKKRRKKDKEPISDLPIEVETIEIEQSPPTKKEKKKKKSKKGQTVEETIVVSEENSDCEIVSIAMKKKKKKSKKNSDESQSENIKIVAAEESIAIDENSNSSVQEVPKKKKRDKKKSSDEEQPTPNPEVNTNETVPISNTQFIDGILSILANNNHSGHSSTALKRTNANDDDDETGPMNRTNQNIAMDEIFEINRYHAEMFRFVDLDGFPNANLSDLSGYGFSKQLELKVSEKSKDQTKINDLWDYALINKYGKDVIQVKKAKRYSMKQLKKKNLFMKL